MYCVDAQKLGPTYFNFKSSQATEKSTLKPVGTMLKIGLIEGLLNALR